MKASVLIKILSAFPDADVSVYEADDVGEINVTVIVVDDEIAFCIDKA